jgi:hypothetical protein
LREVKPGVASAKEEVVKKWTSVKGELDVLKSRVEEIKLADQDELHRVREEISIVTEGLDLRRQELATQTSRTEELGQEELEVRKRIEVCRERVLRAERVKELNRGFERTEVLGMRGLHDAGPG